MKFALLSQDTERDYHERALAGKPWAFVNLLPYTINVYAYRPQKFDLIATIEPHQTTEVQHTVTRMPLAEGTQIYVTRPGRLHNPSSLTTAQYAITRAATLRGDSRVVKIGDIVYEDRVAFTNGIDIHHDIIGIRIHNHLTMPVDIYHKGNMIATIEGDDGTSFMSGSPNSVYLDNQRFGFEIGDEIGFIFRADQKKYAVITLTDNFTSDIIIGMTTQKDAGWPVQDRYSYRVSEPNITGTTYFEQVTGYDTSSKYVKTIPPHKPYYNVNVAGEGIKL